MAQTIQRSKRTLARVAGWIAVAFGVTHIIVAPLEDRDVWSDVFDQGLWNTVSLDGTGGDRAYTEAFWVSPGSFGVPVLLFGAFVLWGGKRGERVPALFGWAMIAWSAVLVTLVPASPAWALLLTGVLLVLAARAPGTGDIEDHEDGSHQS